MPVDHRPSLTSIQCLWTIGLGPMLVCSTVHVNPVALPIYIPWDDEPWAKLCYVTVIYGGSWAKMLHNCGTVDPGLKNYYAT